MSWNCERRANASPGEFWVKLLDTRSNCDGYLAHGINLAHIKLLWQIPGSLILVTHTVCSLIQGNGYGWAAVKVNKKGVRALRASQFGLTIVHVIIKHMWAWAVSQRNTWCSPVVQKGHPVSTVWCAAQWFFVFQRVSVTPPSPKINPVCSHWLAPIIQSWTHPLTQMSPFQPIHIFSDRTEPHIIELSSPSNVNITTTACATVSCIWTHKFITRQIIVSLCLAWKVWLHSRF